MIYLLGGYMWLFIHRPFEVWPALGAMQIERGYMLMMLLVWLVAPGKCFVPNRIHAAFVVFTFTLFSAWAMSPYADRPGVTDVVENYLKVAVFYVLVVTSVRDERGLRLLVLMFVGSVGVYMAHSMLEFAGGRYEWRQGISRMVGVDFTYSDPNAFASTLVYTMPLLLAFWAERPRRLPRWLLLGFFLAAMGCVLLTGSRAGFIGACAFCCLALWVSSKHKGTLIVGGAFAGLFGFVVLSAALPGELQDRYLTLVDSSKGPANAQVSAEGRLDGFMFGIAAWQKSPLLGHGPASFAYVTGRAGQAHNLYGQTLSELGLMGGLSLLGLVVCFAWNYLECRRYYRRDGGPPAELPYLVCRSVGLCVLLMLLLGWAGHNLFRYNWMWLAAFQAVALHCARTRAQSWALAEESAPPPLPALRPRLGRG
jgi:O-antigen ligase